MFSALQSRRISKRQTPAGKSCISKIQVVLVVFAASGPTAHAFDQLTPAQNLVYNKTHLINTQAGQQITYRYQSQVSDDDIVNDRVLLSIVKSHDDDKRDVVLDFLSAERHVAFPDFNGFRGNPVIIAMLEHVAQSFGRETGGGVLYFRNRIRDALARDSTEVEETAANFGTTTVAATRVSFSPFADDQYLAEKPEYTSARFSIILSEKIPGGVAAVTVKSVRGDTTFFEREIAFEKITE